MIDEIILAYYTFLTAFLLFLFQLIRNIEKRLSCMEGKLNLLITLLNSNVVMRNDRDDP